MTILSYIFWFVIVLSIVVFIHEFGHYIVARWCGVKIETFSIGFGREIVGWTDARGTRWKVSVVPLGGYVKMFGDADVASTPDESAMDGWTEEEKKGAFATQSLAKRIAVVFAGPLFNYASAVLIMAMVFWTYGKMYTPSEVVSVIQDAPAYSAGVRAGDIITAVDGQKTESFEKVRQVLAIAGIKAVEIEVLRGSKSQVLLVTPEIKVVNDSAGNKVEMPFIGIASGKHEVRELNMIQALGESVYESYSLTVSMLQGLQQVVTGQRGFEQMGGPIKIAQYSGESAKNGVLSFLWFIVIISLNLAIMNLLPLPMLDGGHLLYYIIELITGKKVSSNFQMVAAKISIALLLFLMIMITYYDIIGIINR